MNVTAELRSDQALLCLDRAVTFLHGAVEALEQDILLCTKGSERASEVANLLSKVRDIQKRAEAIEKP